MNSRGLLVVVACAVAIAAAWMGWRAYSASHRSPIAAVQVPVGTASPPNPSDLLPEDSAEPSKIIPERMPAFSLKNLKGKPTPVSTWAGKSLVINFWATWCAPCQREIPLLKALASDPAYKDTQIVGIAVDYADKVEEFTDQFKVPYPILVGEQDALDVATQFGVTKPAFPFTVFTDRRGEVVALFVGELHRPQAELILGEVARLDQGQLPLNQARDKIAEGLAALAAVTDRG
jgi:thiol-disulfide isomerase/thioredoxin